MRILTAAQIRAVEERAVDTGLDYLRLMENAGSACARFVAEKAQITLESNTAATVVCGKGKNGGDGFNMFVGDELILEDIMLDNEALITYIVDTLGGVIGEDYADPYGQGRIVAIAKE